ncbi:hypothetical protein HDU91_003482, partial [Kappamyces sp. JEL0680]
MTENKPPLGSKRLNIVTVLFGLVATSLWILFSSKSHFHAGRSEGWNSIRLPPHVAATAYAINATTDLADGGFHGLVAIDLDISASTTFVVVHNVDLEMSFQEMVHVSSGRRYQISGIEAKPEFQFSIFHFAKSLAPGEYRLAISYAGKLSDSLSGYYLSTYYVDGQPHSIATTQFEPTDARKAFPCLDEPSQKAEFEITMAVPLGYHAISNMPEKSNRADQTWHYFEFARTVRMSTYLVAFVVSDFEHISAKTDNNVLVSIFTPPGKTNLGQYALDTAILVLEYYQKSFGIDYPLPKLDMIAIPDFSAGAMENWGLVTYRDTALLYDPATSTASSKQRVATVVAHELAHQWFGNLVTMKWWSDLWLNEGFAEFMEYKAVNYAEPNWNMTEQFIPNELVRSLHADESFYTHEIAIPVKDPSEISSIFDDISYGKGSAILRMLEAWMDEKYGPTTFFSKLHNYLSQHSYGNAETADLWAALRTDQDIGVFMKTWTDQPGFPYLTLGNMASTGFEVRQERFLFANLIKIPSQDSAVDPKKQAWSVPLAYTIYSNATGAPRQIGKGFAEINTREVSRVDTEIPNPDHSILLSNHLQTGVYRSLYDQRTYLYLFEWLRADLAFLPAVERGGLISDVFSMTFAGLLDDPTICFQISTLLANEINVLVWATALKDLESLKNVFALDALYGPIVDYQTYLIEKVIRSIGWSEDDSNTNNHGRALLRSQLLQEAVRNNHEDTVSTALGYFKQLRDGVSLQLSADVIPAVYDAGVIYGDLDDYEWVLSKFRSSSFAPEQQILLHALAATRTPYLQARTLAFAIGGEVRKQDIQGLIKNVAVLSPVGHISVWIFLMDNWDKVVALFAGSGFGKFNDLLKDVTASFTKSYLINEAERLFV